MNLLKTTRQRQTSLAVWLSQNKERGVLRNNIEPAGDPLQPRNDSDEKEAGIFRAAFQNINGTTMGQGFEIAYEIDIIERLGIDAMGMAETNVPWNAENRDKYRTMLDIEFRGSKALFSSSKHSEGKYLPGGTMSIIRGRNAGRYSGGGSDQWGRFTWMTLRGRRDEGILLVSAYRVCQEEGTSARAYTAYEQQHSAMREAGIKRPDPRQRILDDLSELIKVKRAEGYRPVVMLDANEDWVNPSQKDRGKGERLHRFLRMNNLIDPLFRKFGMSPRTYDRGKQRLDYILIDSQLEDSVVRVGNLGSHEGAHSDHALCYIDFDTDKLFYGRIHRPVDIGARQFMMEQSDKAEKFLNILRQKQNHQRIKERVFELAALFAEHGCKAHLMRRYQLIDKDFMETALASAHEAGRKKFGYMRSPDLTHKGELLIFYKSLLNCRGRRAEWSDGIKASAERLNIDLAQFDHSTYNSLRQEVANRRKELWTSQKECAELRIKWLEELAQDRARAEGKPDWEKKMKDMVRTAEERTINRKLTSIIKGQHQRLDRIQIPLYDWFYSKKEDEIYHYSDGVFESHAAAKKSIFHLHHTLKVPPPDSVPVEIVRSDDWLILDKYLPPVESLWTDVTGAEDIENLLLTRNKRHLQQTAMEEGISTEPLLSSIREDFGLSREADNILQGRPSMQTPIPENMAAWFRTITAEPMPEGTSPVIGTIPKSDFQTAFKVSKEKTSSSPSGLHYTIWKTMAADDEMAEWMSIMISLPFTYGFANTRWTRAIDVMLEKKKGIRHIHQLRIIGLLEADFNTALKYFFAKKMMTNAENMNLSDEQWGGRKDRSSIDAAMLKLLTFECSRTMKSTIAGCYYDNTACFDRMYPEISNLIAQRYGVDKNLLRARAIVIARMRRHVKTALGTSTNTYQEEDGDHKLNGEIQGKGDVPSLWGIQSDTLLKAHKDLCTGLQLPDCTGLHEISMNNVAFVDDTDGWASADYGCDDARGQAISRLQRGAQVWNDLTNLSGGSIAFHKCKWQMIAWELVRGELQMIKATEEEITLRDNKGAVAIIEFLPPDQPNVGLGYRLCPSGNQSHELEALVGKVTELSASVTASNLSETEARQVLLQRLLPKMSYPLHLTSFTSGECHTLNKIFTPVFLNKMRMNKNMPRPVVYGPLRYGGMEIPDCYSLQTTLQIPFLIKQLRMNTTVANNFLTTLNNIQLVSGLTTNILDNMNVPLDYMDTGWIIALRARMREIGASLWIEDAWVPELQREGDSSIMETFSDLPWMTPVQLRRANAVRLYMKVITISDLVDPTGKFIPDGRLTGEWQAESTLQWPNQPRPNKTWFAVFRKGLRHSVAKSTSPHQPPTYGMDLDCPLGEWFGVARHMNFQCYKTKQELFWWNEMTKTFQVFTKGRVANFWTPTSTTATLPFWSHPVSFQKCDESVWTHRPYQFMNKNKQDPPAATPGLIDHNTLTNGPHQSLKVVSDGGVQLAHQCAAGAWIIAADDTQFVSACFLMTNISSLTSYRVELEGVYRALKHIEFLGLKPEEIDQWCDNKAAVTKCDLDTLPPKERIAPEADIILAIHHLKQKLKVPIRCGHVYGHQDGKNKSQSTKRLSEQAKMNIGCDERATATLNEILRNRGPTTAPLILQPPYEGSKAMLRIGDTWITSNTPKHLHWAHRIPSLKQYCFKRHKWREKTFDAIHWDSIESVRRRLKLKDLVRTSKIMHGWLPLMHNRGHITGIYQCPGCECRDETFHHFLQCNHKDRVTNREEVLTAFWERCVHAKIPEIMIIAVNAIIRRVISNTTGTAQSTLFSMHVNKAIRHQERIGPLKLCQGFLSKQWMSLMTNLAVERPEQKMIALQRTIWFTMITPMWETRNAILHTTENRVTNATDSQLTTRLEWYKSNRHTVLDIHDRRLAEFNTNDMRTWRRWVKREWLRHLDIAMAAYTTECKATSNKQHLITKYFSSKTQHNPDNPENHAMDCGHSTFQPES